MKTCSSCGSSLADDASFCNVCGMPVENQSDVNTFEKTFISGEDTIVLGENDTVVSAKRTDGDANLNGISQQQPENQPGAVQQQFGGAGQYGGVAGQFGNQTQQGYIQTEYAQPNFDTFEQFFEAYAASATKSRLKILAIICFITAGLSLVFVLALGNYLSVVDVAFYTVFGILLLKKRNWVFPLVVTIYSGTFTVITIAMGGIPGGVVSLILGVLSVISMKKLNTAYQEYQSTGVLPGEQI